MGNDKRTEREPGLGYRFLLLKVKKYIESFMNDGTDQ
jgi:hypothetical protein